MNPELRQKPIREGLNFITWTARKTANGPEQGETRLVDYCPGNGTRYMLVVTELTALGDDIKSLGCSTESRTFMVARMNGGAGSAMTVGGSSFLHYRYVQEKLKVSEPDAVVLAEVIGYLCDLEAVSCEEYAERAG